MIFDPLELNYSKIRSFRNCPLLYKHVYLDQKRAPLNAPMSLGISLHKALESYHRENRRALEDLIAAYDSGWVGYGYADAHEQVEYYSKGRGMLEKYWAADQDRKSMVVDVERMFEFPYGKWRIKGTVDRVDRHPDDTLEIIDYKTGAEPPNEAEVAASLQLGVYGVGLKYSLGRPPDRLTILYLAYEKAITIPFDPYRENFIIEQFIKTGEEMLKGHYSPNPAYCPFCTLNQTCAARPGVPPAV